MNKRSKLLNLVGWNNKPLISNTAFNEIFNFYITHSGIIKQVIISSLGIKVLTCHFHKKRNTMIPNVLAKFAIILSLFHYAHNLRKLRISIPNLRCVSMRHFSFFLWNANNLFFRLV